MPNRLPLNTFCFLLLHLLVFNTAQADTSNIVIDFSKPVSLLSKQALSIDESGYGFGGRQILTRDPVYSERVRLLKPALIRIHLKHEQAGNLNSRIICGGAGCATDENGAGWISAMKRTGATPVITVTNNSTHPVASDAAEAAALVHYFNIETKNPIQRWIIGNEPDNAGMNADTYGARFNAIYDAMKRVDPRIRIGGPANAYFNVPFLQRFLQISGTRVDFIDFHQYGQGGNVKKDERTLMAETVQYERNIQTLKRLIRQYPASATRAQQIEVEIGEWNLDWSGDAKQYRQFTTVWGASALGHILQANGISMIYADKNGDLGLLWEKPGSKSPTGWKINDRMPIYHAMGFYTGEGIFPPFGKSLVQAISTLPDVEVYASSQGKSVILINKNPQATQVGHIKLLGLAPSKVSLWQKTPAMRPSAPPARVAEKIVTSGMLDCPLPPYSVTRLILEENGRPLSKAAHPHQK